MSGTDHFSVPVLRIARLADRNGSSHRCVKIRAKLCQDEITRTDRLALNRATAKSQGLSRVVIGSWKT